MPPGHPNRVLWLEMESQHRVFEQYLQQGAKLPLLIYCTLEMIVALCTG